MAAFWNRFLRPLHELIQTPHISSTIGCSTFYTVIYTVITIYILHTRNNDFQHIAYYNGIFYIWSVGPTAPAKCLHAETPQVAQHLSPKAPRLLAVDLGIEATPADAAALTQSEKRSPKSAGNRSHTPVSPWGEAVFISKQGIRQLGS